MRTSTKFVTGKGYEAFAEVFRQYCPAGKVCVVCQDAAEGDALARALGRDYETTAYTPDEARESKPGVATYIGLGGSGVIPAVKRLAGEERFVFYPAYFDYRFLFPFDGRFRLPEFVFLSEAATSGDEYIARLYVAVFQLYAECVFSLTYSSAYPFRDPAMEAYRAVGETILTGKLGKEEFYREGLRFVQNVTCELFARGKKTLATERVTQGYGLTQGDRFAAVRFLLLMAKNFTKRRICDILLPSERTGTGARKVAAGTFSDEYAASDELVGIATRKVAFLTETEDARLDELLDALSTVGDDPLFARINEEGITETIAYERSQRGKSIFV